MSKNTSILLGNHFDKFIHQKIASGKYTSVSEVIRTALRLLELEEQKTKQLQKALETGEKSQMVTNFNSKKHLQGLHKKHA